MHLNGWHRLWIVASIAWAGVLTVAVLPKWLEADIDTDLIRSLALIWVITSIVMLVLGYGIAWVLRGFHSR